MAYIEGDECELVSRRGNAFKSFAPLRAELATIGREVILDGEVVCLDAAGKPQLYELFRRRGEPVFYAFDVLWLAGADLRSHPTIERKAIPGDLVRDQPRILYASHFEARGVDLFRLVCEQDMEASFASTG
jgi:ATP-dependent DNA ligase